MNSHPVTFEDLVDWLDGRLAPDARRSVEAHLEAGCPTCEADLRFLRRFRGAARFEGEREPAQVLVARVKASYRLRTRRAARPWPRLRLGTAMAAIVAMILLAGLLQVPLVRANGAILAGPAAGIEARQGPGAAWGPATAGELLLEGSAVRTGTSALLHLFDGSTVQMQPGAEIALVSLRSAIWGAGRRVTVAQYSGQALYDISRHVGLWELFAVRTPSALIAVQGTRFTVTVGSADETTVEVLEGLVTASGGGARLRVRAGQAATVSAGGALRLREDGAPEGRSTGEATPRPSSGAAGSGQGPQPWSVPFQPSSTPPPSHEQRRVGPGEAPARASGPGAADSAGSEPSPAATPDAVQGAEPTPEPRAIESPGSHGGRQPGGAASPLGTPAGSNANALSSSLRR